MSRGVSRGRAITIGLFLLSTIGLGTLAVVGVSGRQWRLQPTFRVRADFSNIGGLAVGDRVRIQGIDAGVVESVVPPEAPGGRVGLWLRVDERLHSLVRVDALATIAPQGIVGARIVEIQPGKADALPLSEGGVIASQPPRELSDLLRDAQSTLKRVDSVALAAEKGLTEVNALVASVRAGKGSLGKFIQDDEAYRAVVSLSGRSAKTLNELQETLTAMKHTWPISRYFNDRAYFDREQVLFKPNAAREGRSLNIDSLFEPGRSVLTAPGRHELDVIGAWFKHALNKRSEVVIAVFTPTAADPELAQMLTQEQANTIRKYLNDRYKIEKVSWLTSRKVTAIGYGTQVPRLLASEANVADQRVEIIMFTPQS